MAATTAPPSPGLGPFKWVALLAVLIVVAIVGAESLSPPAPPPLARAAPPTPSSTAPTAAHTQPDESPGPDNAQGRAVRGRVVDQETAQPVAGASVTAGVGQPVATADDGSFTVPARAARAALRVVARGYRAAMVEVSPADGGNVLVGLERVSLLKVRVVEAGQPVPGARISVTPPNPVRTTVADGEGWGFFEALEPDGYKVTASRPDGLAAGHVQAVVADRAHVEVSVMLVPAAAVAGTVLEADGTAAAGASVWVEGDDGAVLASGMATVQGKFELQGVPAGDDARVHATREGRHGRSERLSLGRGKRTDGVTVTLGKGGSFISGLVVDDDDVPLDRVTVELAPGWRGGQVTWATTATDQDGRFKFTDIENGRYDLTARNGHEEAVADEVMAGRDIVIRFAARAMIKGRVVTAAGVPVRQYTVRAHHAHDIVQRNEGGRVRRGTDLTRAITAEDGRFEIGPFRRGQYELEVTTPEGAIGRGAVTVLARGADAGDIKVDTSGFVTGAVVDRRTAAPVVGAVITSGPARSVTGVDGRFELAVPAGKPDLWVAHPGYFGRRVEGPRVEVGQRADVGEVALVPGSRREIEGRSGFGGVGAILGSKDGATVIQDLVGDGPATRAGLKKGDVVLSVDGEDVGGRGVQEAIANIRGEAGSTVWIKVRRGNEELNLPIRREPIRFDG